MAFDGIITAAMTKELQDNIILGKVDKVYQPEADELVLNIHTREGNKRLYATVDSSAACLRLMETNPVNPPSPLAFCMLLRKHLQGGRIVSVEQRESERIIEISLETLNELGFTTSKKLIFEIMGKHSNIVLVDMSTGKIIDSIKRISIDVNRVRQILPGKVYEYPPAQDKAPFKDASADILNNAGDTGKAILSKIGGISPAVAAELVNKKDRRGFLDAIMSEIACGSFVPRVYEDEKKTPREFHIMALAEYEDSCDCLTFHSLSQCLTYYFEHKTSSNRARQKSHDLVRSVTAALDKDLLKKQRLEEDLLSAENSEDLRLYGELLTANIHLMKSGMKEITVTNYYDGSDITIPLDPRFTANKNAQSYFKRYGKSKTAIKEKKIQLQENQGSIDYLESVLTYLNNTDSIREIEELRTELEETGYVRRRKQSARNKNKKFKAQPRQYDTSDGFHVLVGKNNKENDQLTLHTATKTDYWFHTKDIPGSHVIVQTEGRRITETAIFEGAALAAFHSKARDSENVPVDYVPVKYVKKPAGAKPGMVIFTNNKTVWVNPAEPEAPSDH
ncbi:Rqc2 family fibronectin-binding protein [Aminicella lysinilytica]|uniref:Rqc2 homolog RqcH n=1 Tax=Aminicella lysinilytica TaxID=433323 RepID=A0A4R6Q0A5_9FIRM|nr:NFACT RNA binding domain-containing protein [Aminicella lysinilytica]NLD10890.1 fibronectin/fibrinogen-binding protein [Clostridiales bacterium]TDP54608.1 putative ribosome quality control (RQC) complex YloA/Tae2 family protein [Aminicella lysinilytica]